MRTLVFFDLPVDTEEDRRNYRRFHKYLIKSGYLMLQESVYCRLSLNGSAQATLLGDLRKHRPPAGVVQVLTVTEKQYARMEYLTGSYEGDVICTDERLVIL
ncbi:MAG: CRISPR-associated endonuclease Cas2 [Oscillospiraceae bacterium]|nr:CRISPR-associated endonuclease Cas2 [Oscillospiraceae bacterium]